MNERWLRVRHIALPYAPARRQREGDEHRVVSVDEPDDAVDDADDDAVRHVRVRPGRTQGALHGDGLEVARGRLVIRPFIHSLIWSFVRSFTRSFGHSPIHSLAHLVIRPLTRSRARSSRLVLFSRST